MIGDCVCVCVCGCEFRIVRLSECVVCSVSGYGNVDLNILALWRQLNTTDWMFALNIGAPGDVVGIRDILVRIGWIGGIFVQLKP